MHLLTLTIWKVNLFSIGSSLLRSPIGVEARAFHIKKIGMKWNKLHVIFLKYTFYPHMTFEQSCICTLLNFFLSLWFYSTAFERQMCLKSWLHYIKYSFEVTGCFLLLRNAMEHRTMSFTGNYTKLLYPTLKFKVLEKITMPYQSTHWWSQYVK